MLDLQLKPPIDLHGLYNDHHHWLLGVLRRRIGCLTTAEDLSHDVFVRLLGRPQLPEFKEPRAYLARMAHGMVIDRHRRLAVEQAWLESIAALPADQAPSAEEQVLVIDALARLDGLLEKFHPRIQTIFLMSRLEGIAYAEIARRLDVSLSTVQKAMTQALRHCYQILMG